MKSLGTGAPFGTYAGIFPRSASGGILAHRSSAPLAKVLTGLARGVPFMVNHVALDDS